MATKTHTVAFFAIVFFLHLSLSTSRPIASPNDSDASGLRGFDFIYQFGDSLADTGNLRKESPASFCSVSPYGETLGAQPTGRCSNGLLMIDYFAKAFNVPLLNPYLQRDADFTHGVNFAVAGATALDGARYHGFPPTNSSLVVQLGWFRDHLNSTCSSASECKKKLERALFLMGEVGGNDYNYALLSNQTIDETKSLVPEVVQTISNAIEEVISHGARFLVVPGNFPIGCMPVYLTTFGSNDTKQYDNLGCLKDLNRFAMYHNQQLKQALDQLERKYPKVAIYYGDYYLGLRTILHHAASLGFNKDDVFKPCCGNGPTEPCWAGKGVPLCPDPTKRISWDGIHLTQEAYRNLADFLLSNTFRHHDHDLHLHLITRYSKH